MNQLAAGVENRREKRRCNANKFYKIRVDIAHRCLVSVFVAGVILTTMMFLLIISAINKNYENYIHQYELNTYDVRYENNNLKEQVSALTKELDTLKKEQAKVNSEYQSAMTDLQNEYNATVSNYNALETASHIKLKDLRGLLDKYNYVIEATSNKSDITISDLGMINGVASEQNVNPHIVTSIFKKESGFYSKAESSSSTATGYGQILASTGKYIYHDLLNNNSAYNHDVIAKNPDTNIKMTFAYLKKLLNDNKGNLRAALISYNGSNVREQYAASVISYMKATSGFDENTVKYV